MKTKPKRGRPTKYTAKTSKRVRDYITMCLEKEKFPTIEGLAAYLRVGVRTINDWQTKYDDFSPTIEILKDTQRELLINNGLTGEYNTRFAMFLLKANHGMTEKDPVVSATQNSFMNISPELLADALELMKHRDGQD